MQISKIQNDKYLIYTLSGRLDAFGASELEADFASRNSNTVCLIIEMSNVDYISSAGLRTLLVAHKELLSKNGAISLVGLQPYCRNVLDISGFSEEFNCFNTAIEASDFCKRIIGELELSNNWDSLDKAPLCNGEARIMDSGGKANALEVQGDVRDVLGARIATQDIRSISFADAGYSIGIGGLGDSPADCEQILGTMITGAGTMAWLPTDGHDAPDFLAPKTDAGKAIIQAAYNVRIPSDFNELVFFKCHDGTPASIGDLYKELFKLSKQRRPDYKGILAIVMRAQMATVFSSDLIKAPFESNAPENGKIIMHSDNIDSWLKRGEEPLHRNVSALICGVGANLMDDLSDFEEDALNRVFYLHPANIGGKSELLHNNALIYDWQAIQERPVDVDKEARELAKNGNFIDMRYLREESTISEAFIGISFIQKIDCIRRNIDESRLTYPNPRPADHTASKRTLIDSYKKSQAPRR